MVGEFHEDEVKAKSGEKWFGIYRVGRYYELVEGIINVEKVPDVVVGDKEDEPLKWTGKKVSFKINEEIDKKISEADKKPIVILKGPGLKGGDLKTASDSTIMAGINTPSRFNGPNPILALSEREIFSFSLTPHPSNNEKNYHNFDFKVQSQGNSQVVASSKSCEDLYNGKRTGILPLFCNSDGIGFPEILWAGDLDLDNKLDIIVSPHYHYNVSYQALFLSSKAKKGEFFGKAAEFSRAGC